MTKITLFLAALLIVSDAWADDAANQTVTKTIEIKLETNPGGCEASNSMQYFQLGNEAQVETRIDTPDCDAASGSYEIKLTIRADGAEDPEVLHFEETWERSDNTPVESTHRYPIGDNVDLLGARTRGLTCTCAVTTADEDGTE